MADEATDDEEGKEAADSDAAAAPSAAKTASGDGAEAVSEELLKLRLEGAPEKGGQEAACAGKEADKENAPVKEGGPAAATEREDGELSCSARTCKRPAFCMLRKMSLCRTAGAGPALSWHVGPLQDILHLQVSVPDYSCCRDRDHCAHVQELTQMPPQTLRLRCAMLRMSRTLTTTRPRPPRGRLVRPRRQRPALMRMRTPRLWPADLRAAGEVLQRRWLRRCALQRKGRKRAMASLLRHAPRDLMDWCI